MSNRILYIFLLIFYINFLELKANDRKDIALISCNLIAEPIINGEFIDLKVYIQNEGDDFALGKSTFAFSFDLTKMKFDSFRKEEAIIYDNNSAKGYLPISTNPSDTNIAYRTIEINYDSTSKPQPEGIIVPKLKTYLGTLRFKILNKKTSFKFNWHISTIIRTINNTNINVLCTKSELNEFILYTAKLTSPIGGESFYPDRKTDIKWTSNGGFPIFLQYTVDGTNWLYIEQKTILSSKLSYNWTIPKESSEHCQIRILDSASTFELTKTPEFSIFPGFSYFLRPSVGDALYYAGKTEIIEWTCEGFNKLKFEISTDGKSSWSVLATGVLASLKELSWKVPNATTKNAYMRMIDFETGKEICETGPFKILTGNITFKNPTMNETIIVNKTYRIRWTSANISTFDLEYSIDNGKSWMDVAFSVNALNNYYDWKVPANDSKTAMLRALFNDDPEMEYGKSGTFIMKNPVGIEEKNISEAIILYPNPTSDYLEISFDSPFFKWGSGVSHISPAGEGSGWTLPSEQTGVILAEAGIYVEIYNIIGEKIPPRHFALQNATPQEGNLKIDVSNLPSGVYFIKIGNKFEKFIKY